MNNSKQKLIFYRILIFVLVIIAIIIASNIIKKQHDDKLYDIENRKVAEQFEELVKSKNVSEKTTTEEISLTYNGYDVIGLIEIPKIDLKYPILYNTTKATMRTSISRFYGGEINSIGNVSLAGHNNYNGTMFGKNYKLNLGDKILLTDLHGNVVTYEIYDIFSTNPNDVSILKNNYENIREVTLITCKNGNSKRLIIKAKEMS